MPHHAAAVKDRPTLLPAAAPHPQAKGGRAQDLAGQSLSAKAYAHIVAWMRARIDETITEDRLCTLSPLGKHAFRRAFEAHAGMSPMHFLTWLRVDTAVRLLIDTRFEVTEIAFVTGFKSEAGLVAACLSTLGVRPQALRVPPGPVRG